MNDAAYEAALEIACRKARTDFSVYVGLMNPPEAGFVFSRLHRHLASLVQDVTDETRGNRQAVSVPPQHGKTRLLTIEAASWLLGRKPGIQIAITGFSHELMCDFSKAIKERVMHPFYQAIFPGCVIVDGFNRADLWQLSNGSRITAKSVGKKLTGRRVDWLIVDDAHAGREEAESETMRRKVIQWFNADCVSRLSPTASVFVVGTRWHRQDLIGYLTSDERREELEAENAKEEIFEVTNLPAVCEDEDSDPLGRRVGQSLFPQKRGKKFLRKTKGALPSYEWRSQYQGDPTISLAGNFDRENLRFISPEEVPPGLEIVRGWDIAVTEKQTSDFSAGCLLAYDAEEDRLFILDMHRTKQSWTKLRKTMIERTYRDHEEFRVHRIGIEAVAGFIVVAQDLKKVFLGTVRVERKRPPRGGKLLRAQPWLNKIEAGRVFLVRGPWNKEFIAELEVFPLGDHDDQVDAVSTAWETVMGRHRSGIRPEGRRRAAKRERRERPSRRPWHRHGVPMGQDGGG